MAYIYERLTTHEIAHRLKADDNAAWSYEGSVALAKYLEQLAEDTGEAVEFAVVDMRCDFSEYENLAEFNSNYDEPYADLDAVREDTTVIEIPGTDRFIAQAF